VYGDVIEREENKSSWRVEGNVVGVAVHGSSCRALARGSWATGKNVRAVQRAKLHSIDIVER
jgi:hypothetical protein